MSLYQRFRNIVEDESIPASDRVHKFLDELKSADESLHFLQCLEDAGVDNWSGFEYAQEEYHRG